MNTISHITLGSNDLEMASRFYDAVLSTIGIKRLPKPAGKPPAYQRESDAPVIYIYTPIDGNPATVGNGSHLALLAPSRAAVRRFYEMAPCHGGSSEGAPGPRPDYGTDYYACYVRDPDGNKLQAVCLVE